MKFLVVEDSRVFAVMFQHLLERAGHTVSVELDSSKALDRIRKEAPDCVLLDVMMPKVDGFTLLEQIRTSIGPDLKVIIVSAKSYDSDRRTAQELGATGFINKVSESETLLQRIEDILIDRAKLTFWGVRGTLPVSGAGSLRYGGNTSCVSLEFSDGRLFIFDAGSGIKHCGDALMRRGTQQLKGRIFISHPHFDHIQALPFFTPLYIKGNEFEILGAVQKGKGMRELIAGQMDGVYFPITTNEFAARVSYRDITEGSYTVDGVTVKTLLLNHPGHCLAYRVEYRGVVFCYATDNELFPPSSPHYNEDYRRQLADFLVEADYLVTDTTYMDDEYIGKEHWGHSCVSEVVSLAAQAKIKTLCLFHHDPDQNDDAIDKKLAFAQHAMKERGSATRVIAPAEGDSWLLEPS